MQGNRWVPLLWRFTKDSCSLAPWRMSLFVLSKLFTSITPAVKLWATTKMLGLIELAVATGHLDKPKLCLFALISGLLGSGIRKLRLLE